MKTQLIISPAKLFSFARAFEFTSGRGRCFSPGGKALLAWYRKRLYLAVVDKSAMKLLRYRVTGK